MRSSGWVGAAAALLLLAACSQPQTPAPGATSTTLPSATLVATATSALPSPTPLPASPTPTTAAATLTPAPTRAPAPAVVLSRGPTDRRAVALTFDAGSDRGYALEILDLLRARGIHASFGLTGAWAERNPDLVRRIAADGHTLINHSYSHDSFTGFSTNRPALTQQQRFQELDRTEEIVRQLTGVSTLPFFRPPYGDYDASVNRDVGLRGYAYNVMWTVDSRGWMGLPAVDIVARCLELAVPGAIYVFHVGSASADAQALPAIIDGLQRQGYAMVSIADFVSNP